MSNPKHVLSSLLAFCCLSITGQAWSASSAASSTAPQTNASAPEISGIPSDDAALVLSLQRSRTPGPGALTPVESELVRRLAEQGSSETLRALLTTGLRDPGLDAEIAKAFSAVAGDPARSDRLSALVLACARSGRTDRAAALTTSGVSGAAGSLASSLAQFSEVLSAEQTPGKRADLGRLVFSHAQFVRAKTDDALGLAGETVRLARQRLAGIPSDDAAAVLAMVQGTGASPAAETFWDAVSSLISSEEQAERHADRIRLASACDQVFGRPGREALAHQQAAQDIALEPDLRRTHAEQALALPHDRSVDLHALRALARAAQDLDAPGLAVPALRAALADAKQIEHHAELSKLKTALETAVAEQPTRAAAAAAAQAADQAKGLIEHLKAQREALRGQGKPESDIQAITTTIETSEKELRRLECLSEAAPEKPATGDALPTGGKP